VNNPLDIIPNPKPTAEIEYIDWYPKSSVSNDIVVATTANGITDSPEHPSNIILGLTFGAASNDINEGINNTAPIDIPIIQLLIAIAFTIGLSIVYNVRS
jgi:hypothetical protein